MPTAQDVGAAAQVLAGIALRTPLIASPALDALTGGARVSQGRDAAAHRLVQVPRCLQQAGLNSSARQRAGGVVAFSSGNHAQGVAAAAGYGHAGRDRDAAGRTAGPSAPARRHWAPRWCSTSVRGEDREAIARDIAGKRNAVLVPPYDDPLVIAGQGTVGREIVEEWRRWGWCSTSSAVDGVGRRSHGRHCARRDRTRTAAYVFIPPSRPASTTMPARSRAGGASRMRR